MRKSYSGTKERPCIQEATSVGEVWAHHDQSLDAEEGWCVQEGGMTESLHTGVD